MKVAVFDTYVKNKLGGIMHFDVIVPQGTDVQEVYRFGHEYLRACLSFVFRIFYSAFFCQSKLFLMGVPKGTD